MSHCKIPVKSHKLCVGCKDICKRTALPILTQETPEEILLFEKDYDGESFFQDLERDIYEAPMDIPVCENNIHLGTFTVTVKWKEEE